MKKLRDRFDVLLDNAKDGDSTAQLELAHCFYEGKLVEQSIENARYWAFKAADGGNKMAETYYNAITRPTS